jgi:hypothetical protein
LTSSFALLFNHNTHTTLRRFIAIAVARAYSGLLRDWDSNESTARLAVDHVNIKNHYRRRDWISKTFSAGLPCFC